MLLIEKDITKPQLRRDLNLATGTMSKLNKGEDVALSVLLYICDYLDCDIADICGAMRVKREQNCIYNERESNMRPYKRLTIICGIMSSLRLSMRQSSTIL